MLIDDVPSIRASTSRSSAGRRYWSKTMNCPLNGNNASGPLHCKYARYSIEWDTAFLNPPSDVANVSRASTSFSKLIGLE